MRTVLELIKEMETMGITQASVYIATRPANGTTDGYVSESEFSRYLRGLCELSPAQLRRIDIAVAALSNICFDGHAWPLNWRAPRMVEIIRHYVKKQEDYREEIAAQGEKFGKNGNG